MHVSKRKKSCHFSNFPSSSMALGQASGRKYQTTVQNTCFITTLRKLMWKCQWWWWCCMCINRHPLVDVLLFPGFHLSATVVVSSSGTKGQFNVAVTFDRGRITTCNCTCSANASWCSHVVAVCLHRIHQVWELNLSCFRLLNSWFFSLFALETIAYSYFSIIRFRNSFKFHHYLGL